MNYNRLGEGVLSKIRSNPKFPFDTGHLKWDATYMMPTNKGFEIIFDGQIAPYIDFLEYGTGPHKILNGFGRGITIFHPGSTKHVGFISNRAVDDACEFLCGKLNGKRVS